LIASGHSEEFFWAKAPAPKNSKQRQKTKEGIFKILGLVLKSIKSFIAPPIKSESPAPGISLVAEAVKGAGSRILRRKEYELENLPRLVQGKRRTWGVLIEAEERIRK
jgi:hypothetical protein